MPGSACTGAYVPAMTGLNQEVYINKQLFQKQDQRTIRLSTAKILQLLLTTEYVYAQCRQTTPLPSHIDEATPPQWG